MPEPPNPALPVYAIDVGVRLSGRLRDAFGDFTVSDGPAGSRLTGPVVDQAALYGVLARLRDLGIPLVSLRLLPPDQPV